LTTNYVTFYLELFSSANNL